MIQDRLRNEVDKVAARYRTLRLWRAFAVAWFAAAVISLLAWGLAAASGLRVVPPLVGALGLMLVSVGFVWFSKRLRVSQDWVAHQIEATYPDLQSGLLAALEQRPALADGRLSFLQDNVIRQALVHAECHHWPQLVPARRITAAILAQFVTLGLYAATLMLIVMAPPSALIATTTDEEPLESPAAAAFTFTVEPGDTEIERGASLLVLARVQGEMPSEAALVVTSAGSEPSPLAMSRSLDDPVFGGRVPSVQQTLEYHVESEGQTSPTYRVTVFDYPRLERADARLVYPSYTGLEERLVQDVRTVSVVEGTQVTLICTLNKRVKSATLVERSSAKRSPAARSPVAPRQESRTSADVDRANDDSNATDADSMLGIRLAERDGHYEATLTADQSRRWKLDLIDDAGRHNVEQAEIAIQVVPNQPPTLKLAFPARDLEVSPLEELDVKATAWDDFGLKRMGLTFALAGRPPTDLVLGENGAAKQKHELANVVKLEDLKAAPDELLSYHVWAEDFGPDGQLRRTMSDMYFAEVRHFEEIFRQGQQPPGGQQQQRQGNSPNAQAAQQLAQSQKDIINATWKVIRREISTKLSDAFAGDIEQIVQSQADLLKKSQALGEKLRDEESQAHLNAVLNAMNQAVKHLTEAHEQPDAAPLQPALATEQAAYQALLRLRAREHEVVRQQQQPSSSSSASASRSQQQRQQMQQLDLKDEENRYETQRLAQSKPESAEDREARQVLNRLRELAQRQHDLNERLKDLQSALQEAKTAEQKEDIRQQLKRLQDEQRQVLRDTDELKSRMETAENQERMSAEREQLEQTRDQVRRAAESLENEMVTQAAASGSRAEREFEELKNEFRRRASNRFNEDMREMRDAARELDRQQNELSERLTEVAKPEAKTKSLRDDNRSEDVQKGLAEQRQRLTDLLERMKQTIQEAEQSEPLLSERLYDAARNAQQQNVDRALDATSRSLQRGLMEDAQQIERIANQGITQLREGVERAAEAVVGDETEALRRAREELRRLSQELNRELARNAPNEATQLPRSAQEGERGRQGEGETNGERQPGQLPNGQPENGQRPGEQQSQEGQQPGQQSGRGQQPNERQPNESQRSQQPANGQQPGERQPGQQPNGQQPGQPQGNQPQRGQQGKSQPGQSKAEPSQNGQSQSGPQPRQQDQAGTQPQDGQRQPGQRQPGQQNGQRGPQRLSGPSDSVSAGPFYQQGSEQNVAPITGEDFLKWSDRLRDVEEMVDDPDLRAEAARIRDQARAIRAEFKRHSQEPNWNLVRVNVAEPLVELTNRLSDELLRRTSKQALVPLDRDPVPPKYSEKTRRYYERLGSGQ